MDDEGREGRDPTEGEDHGEPPQDPTVGDAPPPPEASGPATLAERAVRQPDWVSKSLGATMAGTFADSARWAELMGPTVRMVEQAQRKLSMNQAAMQSIYDSSRVFDRILPDLVKPFELAAASQMAKLVSGASPLFTARVALDAQFRLAETLGRIQLPAVQIAALTGASRSITLLSETLIARTRIVWDVDRSMASMLAGWKAATFLPRMPAAIDFSRLTAAGLMTWESTRAGALILDSPTVEVVEPAWEEAPGDVRARLRVRLQELDAALVRKLDGARERLASPGPDAAGQAATSLVELIDWALRMAAPEKEVLRWHSDNARPDSDLHGGRPTRRLKVEYVLVMGGRDPKAGEHFTKGLLGSLEWLEGAKHKLAFDDVTAVECLGMAVEGYLAFVLL
jgi:hypothetical protein